MEWLEQIDRDLLLWFNGFHNPFFDDVFLVITSKWFGVPFYLLALFLFIKRYGWRTGLILTSGVLITFGLTDQISSHVFKDVFLRWRPGYNTEIKHLVHNIVVDGEPYRGRIDASFLSAHASNMFAIATFVGLCLKRRALWIGWFLAALIAYSRIYLGVHYPADVACGTLLGLLIGWLVFRLYNNFLNLKSK